MLTPGEIPCHGERAFMTGHTGRFDAHLTFDLLHQVVKVRFYHVIP